MKTKNEGRMRFLDWIVDTFSITHVMMFLFAFSMLSGATLTYLVVERPLQNSLQEQQLIHILKTWK